MLKNVQKNSTATGLGLTALFIWFTVFAFSRSLAEQLGPLTSSAVIYLLAGVVGCIFMFIKNGFDILKCFSNRYLFVCGGLFILYMISLNLAIGWAINRQQTIEIVMINYLWPVLTMVVFIPVLKYRANSWFTAGIFLAVAGVCLTATDGKSFSFQVFLQNIQTNCLPYSLAIISAVSWALYSGFNRRFASEASVSAVPVFVLCCGIFCLIPAFISHEHRTVNFKTCSELLYAAIFPNLLAYIFWDNAMRKGNAVLVASISYVSPIFSIAVTSLYLHVPLGLRFYVASVSIIAGSVICRKSIFQQRLLSS